MALRQNRNLRLRALLAGVAGLPLLGGYMPAQAGPAQDALLNKAVIQDARDNIADIMRTRPPSEDSQRLARLQEEFNVRLKRQGANAYHSRMIYADPVQYDSALAVGLSPEESLKAFLQVQGVTVNGRSFGKLLDGLNGASISEAWTAFFATKPMAVSSASAGGTCVAVPATSYAGEFQGNVIDIDTFLEFIDRHEGWHCLDSENWRKIAKFPAGYETTIEKMKHKQVVSSAEALDFISTGMRIEAFADLGALGDMVVAGRDLKIFDTVIANRAYTNQVDLLHTSTPAILGLKQEIEGMGMAAFRAMTDDARMTLYYKVVGEQTLNGRQTGILMRYQDGDRHERTAIERQEEGDADTTRAMRYMRDFFQRTDKAPLLRPPLGSEEREKLRREVDAYNAGVKLLDTAFKAGGVVTPRTLLAAHETLQAEMRALTRQNPANPLYPSLSASLKKTLIDDLATLDFAAANRFYGVTPENSAELARHLNPVHKNPARRQP